MKTDKANLVIVESPAKAKTIEKYLGEDFIVRYSMGHVIDLPERTLGVNIKDNFKPFYVVIPEKRRILQALKREAEDKTALWLASDPDREGEAISWHLKRVLGKGKKVYRVIFHEITESAIKEAFNNPGEIDMKKVNAQQARRILDRILGYTLSPLLWKKVGSGLSAGRVQSVALRLIVERERQIRAFVPKEYWEITAEFVTARFPEHSFKAKLVKIDSRKPEIDNKAKAEEIINNLKDKKYYVVKIDTKERRQNPPPPFTTSKLQQEAFNKLRFSASKTMLIAQQLYEGLDLGEEGRVGLITYMRTDSLRIADQALNEIRQYIANEIGKQYLPHSPNKFQTRKRAQEAHEAIRPTSVYRNPEKIKPYLNDDQYKLYDLIWRKTLATQMLAAKYLQTILEINADKYLFQANGRKVLFPGFTIIYEPAKEEILPELELGEELTLLKLEPSQHFTKPPARYNDASLVKVLEEEGIGRPSTYAPIIQTLVSRDYVRRKGGKFIPTELGFLISDLLTEHFPKIMDVKFTATIEDELDKIEDGKLDWTTVVHEFYKPFAQQLEFAKEKMKDMKKEIEETDIKCELCGKPMVIRWGGKGRFLACSGYPQCRNTKPYTPTGVNCPRPGCDGILLERKNRKGKIFYGCSNYPKCDFTIGDLKNVKADH